METKFFLKSKEVWILGLAVLFVFGETFGLSFENTVESVKDAYVVFAPFIALVLRVFFTSAKLKLIP